MVDLKKLFTNDAWAENKLSRTVIRKEVEQRMFNHTYWELVTIVFKTLWATIHGSLNHGFRSCSNDALCVRVDSHDERESQPFKGYFIGFRCYYQTLGWNILSSTSYNR